MGQHRFNQEPRTREDAIARADFYRARGWKWDDLRASLAGPFVRHEDARGRPFNEWPVRWYSNRDLYRLLRRINQVNVYGTFKAPRGSLALSINRQMAAFRRGERIRD